MTVIPDRGPVRRWGKFAADLGAVLLVTVLAAVGTSALALDMRISHLILTSLTVAVLGGTALLVLAGARAQPDGRFAWAGAALGLYSVLCLPVTGIGPRTLNDLPGLVVALVAGHVAVVVLLLVAPHVPAGPRRGLPWIIAGVALAVAVVSGIVGEVPGVTGDLDTPAVAVALAAAWCVAAVGPLVGGVRAGDRTMWRVGLGLLVLAGAQCHDAFRGLLLTQPSPAGSAIQLVGAVAVLGAVLRHLRGEVGGLLDQRDQQRAELREAVQHVERAAALARERDHELANGLAGLAGIAYLLERPAERSSGNAAVLRSAVLAELARLHTMLGQPGPSAPADRAEAFDVAGALAEIVALRRAAGTRVELAVDGPLPVHADRDAVTQVVTNLLTNSERHAPGSEVRVHAGPVGGQVAVEVHDDGPGPAPGTEDTLLERGVTAGATGGSGLGLYVSRRLLAEQGGSLVVLPARGRGFRVRFTLPAVAVPAARSGTGDRVGS